MTQREHIKYQMDQIMARIDAATIDRETLLDVIQRLDAIYIDLTES